jgi:eukaryotic-like serine/threonine-protein kinase
MALGTFGAFELEALLGRGGMAEVYRARVSRGPLAGRVVALKRLLPELALSSAYVDLFVAEADVTRQLHHPAIIEVLEVGAVGDEYYIAMEYIDGCDLGRILARCAAARIFVPVPFACYVAHVVAEALDFAHRATGPKGAPLGIVHCDVTPANIFISSLGEIRLGDFGVARNGGGAFDEGVFAGKANYLAPEQIDGLPVGPATDVFALGAVLYEMLTNHKAFPGADHEEVWSCIRAGKWRPAALLRPDLPPAAEAVLQRALAVSRGGGTASGLSRALALLQGQKPVRFGSAQEFAEALSCLYDEAIGNPLAIASLVRGLFPASRGSADGV